MIPGSAGIARGGDGSTRHRPGRRTGATSGRRSGAGRGPARVAAFWMAAVAFLFPAAAGAAGGPILVPSPDLPPVVSSLDLPENTRLLAVAPDLSAAAAAFPLDARERRWAIRVTRAGGGTVESQVSGTVRSLVIPPPGERVYAVVHHRTKRGTGSTDLFVLREGKKGPRRLMTLPLSASGLAYSPGARSLLIACRDELRTVVVPELRSGPLFRIGGTNLSITLTPGTGRVLLGRPDGIVLVDPADKPARNGLAIRERLTTPSAVVGLAAAPTGDRAVALLADGQALLVRLDPLRLEPLSRSVRAVAWPGIPEPGAPPPPGKLPPAPAPEKAAPGAPPAASVPPAPAPERATPGPVPGGQPASPPPVEPAPPAKPVPSPPPAPSVPPPPSQPAPPQPPTPPAPPEPSKPAPAERPAPGAATGRVEGRLVGEAASKVRSVILLGPDNILHEAGRAHPGPDGAWSAEGLPPGRYRIVPDAGPDRVVAAEPAFQQVEISAGGVTRARDFHVRRVL